MAGKSEGATLISPELFAQIRRIQIKTRRLVTDVLAGEYASALRGRGMEFDEVREYIPGDDVRAIDWNVTARMGVPHVKIFREERELTLLLLIDVSASQGFGTEKKTKQALAAEIAACFAVLAMQNHDKIGLLLFSDHVERYIPPKKGRAHIWNLIRTVLMHETRGRKTSVNAAIKHVMDTMKRRAVCVLVSDFWDKGYERSLTQLARKHELLSILTRDRRETQLPAAGLVQVHDMESGELLTIDTSDPAFQNIMQNEHARHEAEVMNLFKRQGIQTVAIHTDDAIAPKLMQLLHQNQNPRRSRR
ncbi:MAG: DUF58 domain-containing protein [Oligoflexus sp.]